MPVYPYKCQSCNEKFDVQRSFCEEEKEVKCPECGSADVKKLFTAPRTTSGNINMWRRPT